MKFYSHGKILLTGEYAVLEGVKALALPTQKGQSLQVNYTQEQAIVWRSYAEDKTLWMDCRFNFDFECVERNNTTDQLIQQLAKILMHLNELSPNFHKQGVQIETELEFNRDWGLGSSSTLIYNLAQWLTLNPYKLLQTTMGGSGYDIAVAHHGCPLFYTRNGYTPHVELVDFFPGFADQLFFVHLNQKRKSSEAIQNFQQGNRLTAKDKQRLTAIGEALVKVKRKELFDELLFEHETITSGFLGEPPIKERLFADFHGQIKSLGAWGGDFVLASGDERTPDYFRHKGYPTVIAYADFILTKKSPR